jgi:ElaB/YqjD/DUF883 family membrane-anchored ribosome-binding protein
METNKDFETPRAAAANSGLEKSRRLENLGERADRLTDEVVGKAQDMKERASGALDGTREKVSETYDRTRDTLNRTYDRAVAYGRENPGTAILIGFGAGVGVGLLVAGGAARRSRSGILPAVATSLADIVYGVFDRR